MKTKNDFSNSKNIDAIILRIRAALAFAESCRSEIVNQSDVSKYQIAESVSPATDAHTTKVLVYWIGCAGLETAARRLGPGRRIDRIGCTTERELSVRLSAANADAYGSWVRDETGMLVPEPGFERWIMQRIGTTRGALDPAVIVRTRSIEVQLPPGMTRRWFDRALHAALGPWCLADRDPAAARYTRYSVGIERMSKALEFYVGLDPRNDGDLLLGLVERIMSTYRMKANQTHAAPRVSSIAEPATNTANIEDRLESCHLDDKCQVPSRCVNTTSGARIRTMSPAQINAMRARKQRQRSRLVD